MVEEENDDEINRQRAVHAAIHHAILLDKKYNGDFTLFMTALHQDPGCNDPDSKEKRRIHFPQLQAFAFTMFDRLNKAAGKFPDFLPKNKTRVSKELVNATSSRSRINQF